MKLSVMTCVLGNPEELKDTFNSLLPYLDENFGWLIKATGSSDSFLKNFIHPFVTIIHQKDNSLYDGMNQGLFSLKSEYYFVLGAGDVGLDHAVRELKQSVSDQSSLFFSLIIKQSNHIGVPNPLELSIRMACPHPSTVYRVESSKSINGYDTKYLIASDYDHTSRYVKVYGNGSIYSDILVSYMGGGLSDIRSLEGYLEEELIRKRVWGVNDYQVYASMLQKGGIVASNVLIQIGNLS